MQQRHKSKMPSDTKNRPQRLISEVQLIRIRVATAESELKVLQERARQAKRRRKEAKQIARNARKQVKRSKAELAELREALGKAEARLFKAGGRVLAREIARPRSAAKGNSRPSKKSGPTPRRRSKKPAVTQSKVVARGRADAKAPSKQTPQ